MTLEALHIEAISGIKNVWIKKEMIAYIKKYNNQLHFKVKVSLLQCNYTFKY